MCALVLVLAGLQAYGQTTYLITTLARVPRGTEGAVSLEGTVAGIVAAAVFAAVAFATGQVSNRAAFIPQSPMTVCAGQGVAHRIWLRSA